MTANSRRNPHEKGVAETSVRFAFALGLLVGVAIALIATQQDATARQERTKRNVKTLAEVFRSEAMRDE